MVVQIVRVRKGVVDRKCERKREKREEKWKTITSFWTGEPLSVLLCRSFDHGLLSNIGLIRDRENLHEMQAHRRGVKADNALFFLFFRIMHLPTSSHLCFWAVSYHNSTDWTRWNSLIDGVIRNKAKLLQIVSFRNSHSLSPCHLSHDQHMKMEKITIIFFLACINYSHSSFQSDPENTNA